LIKNTDIFTAYEYLPTPLIVFSNEAVIYANKKALELLEIPVGVKKLNVFDYVLPEYHKEILSRNTKILKGIKLPPYGVKVRTKKKKVIDIETKSKKLVVDSKSYIITIFYEVTERLRLNTELSESKAILDLISNNKTDIVFKYDFYPKEHYAYVSESAYPILGYKPAEWYKNKDLFEQIMFPEDRNKYPKANNAYIASILKNKKSLARFIKKNKEVVWLETNYNVTKNKEGKATSIICISRDVTREKETEATLNITKEQLSLIATNAHDIIYFYTYQPKPKYIFISNSVQKILGYKPDQFYKDPFFISKRTRVKTNDFKEYEKRSAITQKNGTIKQKKVKYQVKNAAGEYVWMEDHINPVLDEDGKVSFLFGIIRNISEIKEKEKELNQKWSDYKLLLDQSPIAFFIHSNGVCLLCNKSGVELLKIKNEKQIIGKNLYNYFTPEGKKKGVERVKKATEGQELDFTNYQIRNAKNQIVNIEIKTVPILYNGINCALSLVKDITEKDIFEKNRIRAELTEESNKKLLKEIEARKAAEAKIIEQKNKLASIFENSSHLVWTVDQSYCFTYFNNNFKNTFKLNYGVEPIVGKPAKQILPSKTAKENINTWEPLYKKVFNGERLVFERKDPGKPDLVREVFMNPIFTSKGEIKEISCMASDISENKRNQKRLIEQSSRISAIFESGTQLVWTVDNEFKYTSFNNNYSRAYLQITGIEPQLGQKALSQNNSVLLAYNVFWQEKYAEAFKGRSLEFTTERKLPNNQLVVRRFYVHPIYNATNEIIELSITGNDITKEVLSQKEILSQSAKLNAIFEGSSHYIWTVNQDNELVSFNKNYTELIRKIYETLPKIGEKLNRGKMIADDAYVKNIERHYNKAFTGQKKNFELELLGKNGEKVYLDVFLNPVFDKDQIIEVSGIAHDITATKQNEDKLTQSLKEKEVLLKEVHHRVKNNMQIISSILNLQSSYTTDNNILNLLRESQNRIKTMAYIHESLYQNKTFSSINFNDYLSQLTNNIIHSYSVSPEKMKLIVNCEKTILNLDISIPLGLIINELVTNSIKHAFPATSKGNITINLKTQNKCVFLTVEDNGVGIDPDMSPENSGSLGLQLVLTLIDQIDGKITFESIRPHGTRVNISFFI
jgi:PAS domain S-box-containing protein